VTIPRRLSIANTASNVLICPFLKSFATAAVTIAGIELAHRVRGRYRNFGSLKQIWERALAQHFAGGNLNVPIRP
jgi:hypothetical protein